MRYAIIQVHTYKFVYVGTCMQVQVPYALENMRDGRHNGKCDYKRRKKNWINQGPGMNMSLYVCTLGCRDLFVQIQKQDPDWEGDCKPRIKLPELGTTQFQIAKSLIATYHSLNSLANQGFTKSTGTDLAIANCQKPIFRGLVGSK